MKLKSVFLTLALLLAPLYAQSADPGPVVDHYSISAVSAADSSMNSIYASGTFKLLITALDIHNDVVPLSVGTVLALNVSNASPSCTGTGWNIPETSVVPGVGTGSVASRTTTISVFFGGSGVLGVAEVGTDPVTHTPLFRLPNVLNSPPVSIQVVDDGQGKHSNVLTPDILPGDLPF